MGDISLHFSGQDTVDAALLTTLERVRRSFGLFVFGVSSYIASA